MESFQIERWPKGIAVTSSGELVYTDDTLNIMNKTYLNSDVGLKLADCIHCSVCNTLYGDLLVVNPKVVRYDYGLLETQCIQYGDEYLYLSGGGPK